ncbi:YfjI family protein [Streptosporangium canum]|uniref:YfjI family protein n=1 Tax=Streptosporangium canum TaxID=324952 RepID=UPI0033BDACFD
MQDPPLERADLEQARQWLTTLHGGAPGLINIVATDEWAGRSFTTDDAGINAAVGYIRALDQQHKQGIYARVTTLNQVPAPGKRGGAADSLSFPGFWGDVDLAGPGHKTKDVLPATVEEAQRIIAVSGLPEPTMWIHSGGGLYPWHLLDEPVLVTADNRDDMATLAARWQLVILAASEQLGYGYGEGVGDLARVLRIPGTINRKAGLARACTVLEASGITYSLDDLATALYRIDLPEPTHAARTAPPPRPRATIYTGGGQVGPFDALAEVCEWRDLFEPAGWTFVQVERDGAELWLRPGGTSKYSVRCGYHGIPVAVVHSEEAGLPSGGGQRLTHGRVLAHLLYGGNETAAAKDLRAAAADDPAAGPARALRPAILDHIRQRCAVRPWEPEVPWPRAALDEHDDEPAPEAEIAAPDGASGDVRKAMAAATEDSIWAGVFPTVDHLHDATWTTPGSDDRPALLPPFPLHTLPGDTGKFVEAVAVYTQTPAEIAAFATIGALSTAVGSHATITGQWTEETLSMFLASIADSGDGKSRAFKAVNAPIYRLEGNLRHAWDAKYGENAEQLEIAQATRDKIIKDLASALGDKRTKALAELDAVKETIKELTGPPRPQLLVGDVLPEALAKLMHRQGGHIGIISAEGTFLGNICGRYNNGKPNLEFVLVSWDASEPWRPDRISRDSFELERPSLALSLSVQPVVIDDAVSSKAVTDKGLLNRFLLTRPASLAGGRDVRPPHIPAYLSQAWDACVQRAFYAACPDGNAFDDDGNPVPPVPMQVAEDAEHLMLTWRERHERRLDPDTGDLVRIKGWMSRAAGNAYRLAALLHLAAGHDPHLPVGVEVMTDALTIIDYCIPHAIAILGGADGGAARGQVGWVKDASEHVLAWIRKKGMGEFTADQARAGLRGRSWVKEHGAPGVRGVLLALAHEGWLASVTRLDAAGRRLSDPLFVVHPQLLGGGV